MPAKKKTAAAPLPADTTVTTEALPNRRVRLTVSIRNTISLGKDSFSSISPGVSITGEFDEGEDLFAAANDLYGRVTPVYGYLLLQETARVYPATRSGLASIIELGQGLLKFHHGEAEPEEPKTGLLD